MFQDDNLIQSIQKEYEAVFRFALTLTKNVDMASDLTQEAFLKAMENIDKFEFKSGIYTWLCAIMKNLWINICRKNKKYISLEMDVNCSDNRGDIEEALINRETARKINEIIETLEEPYKGVFILRVYEMMSFREIALIYDKSENWGRVTYFRARKMLSEKIKSRDLI